MQRQYLVPSATLLAFVSLDCAAGAGSQDGQGSGGPSSGVEINRGASGSGGNAGSPTTGDDATAAYADALAVVGGGDGASQGDDSSTTSDSSGSRRKHEAGSNSGTSSSSGSNMDMGASSDAATADAAPWDTGAASDGGWLMTVYVTFYGWADNSPPGDAIAYPMMHSAAGGTGTYADPITFATDRTEFEPGTILYVPFIEKYIVMEDDCVDCDSEWKTSRKWHIDLWMNSSANESTNALLACENQWTRASTNVEVGPPPDRLVTQPPLFDPAANVCRSSP